MQCKSICKYFMSKVHCIRVCSTMQWQQQHLAHCTRVYCTVYEYSTRTVHTNRSLINLRTVTYFLTFLLNLGRIRKITLTEQFIMAYGGLRGAIAFSLSLTLDPAMLERCVSACLCRVGLLFGNTRRIQVK